MSGKFNIEDGTGKGYKACVNKKHEVCVTMSQTPTFITPGTPNALRYFSSLLGSDGADSGTISANVDGSITPQEFFIGSSEDFDIRIMTLLLVITDLNILHNKFGALLALTNGIDLKVLEAGEETFLIKGAKTNGELIAQTGMIRIFGNGNEVNIIPNFTDNSDGFLISIPISNYIPGGFRVGIGGIDKISLIINDDLTGLGDFTVRAIGYKQLDL